MDDLRSAFEKLDQLHKRRVQVLLCRTALHVWEAYTQEHGPLEYVDSVVGMHHQVDSALPHEALACVESNSDQANVAYRYYEPIVALQDSDLELPTQIEYAYYAIYNLYMAVIQRAATDDWLIVNQALAAQEDSAQWRILLAAALQQAQY